MTSTHAFSRPTAGHQARDLLGLPPEQVALELANGLAAGRPPYRRLLSGLDRDPALAAHVGAGAVTALRRAWLGLQSQGWQPYLLRHVGRTRAVAVEALLADPGAGAGERLRRAPLVDQLALLHDLLRLPALPSALDPARLADAGLDPTGADSDEAKMLARVRALLAKAEATDFPDEAEALTAKAQQIVSRHSLEQALAATADDSPAVVHLTHDAPYAEAKSHLLAAVARANRCRAVVRGSLGISTVLGYRADLRATELVHTSLLVQATHALAVQGARSAQARGRGFKRAFYLAYAAQIGQRLAASRESSEREVTDRAGSKELVPVLARRNAEVDQLVEQQFPQLRRTRTTISNARGYQAGAAAADLADLAALGQVTGR